MWLRHAPAPLLWIHPNAKNRVLMPDGDSNAIFFSRCIFIVGTCPPMKMEANLLFRQTETAAPQGAAVFGYQAAELRRVERVGRGDPTPPEEPSPLGEGGAPCAPDEGETYGRHPLISHLR